MSQHNTMIPAVSAGGYDAARHRAAFLDARDRGRIVVSGTRARVVSAGPADERHRRAEGGRGLLRRVPHRAGPDDRGPLRLRARRRHAADDDRRREGRACWRSSISSSSPRTCSSATSPTRSRRSRSSVRTRRGVVASIVAGVSERSAARHCRSTATCAATWAAARRSSRASTDTGEPGFDLYVERAQARRVARRRSRPRARRRSTTATAEALRIEAGVPLFRPRHGRGDDSARGRHRVARDQLHEGLLRRPGSDHPRAASRPRPRRAQAGRPDARRRARCRRRRARSAAAIARSARSRAARCRRRSAASDRARLRAARFLEPAPATVAVAASRRRRRDAVAASSRPACLTRVAHGRSDLTSISINSASAGGNCSVAQLLARHPAHLLTELRHAARPAARSGRNAARPCGPDRRAWS